MPSDRGLDSDPRTYHLTTIIHLNMNRRRVLSAGTTLTLAGCLSDPGSDADEFADEEFAAELVEDAIGTRRGCP